MNDYFDSVDLGSYTQWCTHHSTTGQEFSELQKQATITYNLAKRIAIAINGFSLRMQKLIYAIASMPAIGTSEPLSHMDIDTLYPRITSAQFREMMYRSRTQGPFNLRGPVVTLLTDLTTLLDSIPTDLGSKFLAVEESTNALVKELKKLVPSSELDGKYEKGDLSYGKLFFQALFKLSYKTAELLDTRHQ